MNKPRPFPGFPEEETGQTIPQRFRRMLALSPNSIAVQTPARVLSYRELDERSNRVAHAVVARDSGKFNTVALLFDQGVDAVIAILGVLKAGRIYVSLDPRSPPGELDRIVGDCVPGVLISANECLEIARRLRPAVNSILAVDDLAEFPVREIDPGGISADSPAYIFYTSGSTGRPKGVIDSHRNVLHNVLRYTNHLAIESSDRLSMIQSCNFSGTVSSLFSALLNGAAICPFNFAQEGIEALAEFLAATQVTIYHSVPSIFEGLVSAGRELRELRVIRLEGDRTEQWHIGMFRENFSPSCQLAIGLGATETGLSRQLLLHRDSECPGAGSPLGYPVEGVEIQLVDEQGREVCPGEPGEIQVNSRYLATGYWRQPGLTAEKFKPCDRTSSMRRYRTGDMARMLPDGCMLYIGRRDARVKLHGVSIETDRVEQLLCTHHQVEQAVVRTVQVRPGLRQLGAYLVTRNAQSLTVSELRAFLLPHLSSFMVPARYKFLEALPVDRHGKVLRGKLPDIDSLRPHLGKACMPAQSDLQAILARCFEEVLSLGGVGIDDDFYDLGGDSLLLMHLLLSVEEKAGLTFPEAEFSENPTIRSLEQLLLPKSRRASVVPLQPEGDCLPLFCLHNQLGVVIQYHALARLLGPDIPVMGIQAAPLPEDIEATSIEAIAKPYAAMILAAQGTGPYRLCGNCFDGLLAFEVARQLTKGGEKVTFLGLIDTAFPVGTLAGAARRLYLADQPAGELGRMMSSRVSRLVASLRGLFGRAGHSADGLPATVTIVDANDTPDPLAELTNNRTSRLMEEAARRYRPKPYAGELTLYYTGPIGNRYGWARVARGGYCPVQLPGGNGDALPHMILQPTVAGLVEDMHSRLSRDTRRE